MGQLGFFDADRRLERCRSDRAVARTVGQLCHEMRRALKQVRISYQLRGA